MPSAVACLLTGVMLSLIQLGMDLPMLLLERFYPGWGWAEVMILSLYAGWLAKILLNFQQQSKWRMRIWGFFSVLFFGQLVLGLIGFEKFLMTGDLHLPVPAVIVAGPIYRGGRIFMLLLFFVTVLIVGPAWCSYLCYIGAWDNWAACRKPTPSLLPVWRRRFRIAVLVVVLVAAGVCRIMGVSSYAAVVLGGVFGLIGVALMFVFSRKSGVMTHCVSYCPIGLLAVLLGRLNPFRVRIGESCVNCGACSFACRYDALHPEDIKQKKPNLSCTLCGDCLGVCSTGALRYCFVGLSHERARAVFIVLVVVFHAVFLGVARI